MCDDFLFFLECVASVCVAVSDKDNAHWAWFRTLIFIPFDMFLLQIHGAACIGPHLLKMWNSVLQQCKRTLGDFQFFLMRPESEKSKASMLRYEK